MKATSRTHPPASGPPPAEPWHALPADAVLTRLGATAGGLSTGEAEARLRRAGPNTLTPPPATPAWRILLNQVRSLVVLLLLAAAVVAWLNGDSLDAAAIAVVLLINVVIGFGTELPARRALEGLRRLEVSRATVRRDGRIRELDARFLVPGDVIEVEAGRHVPADARLLAAEELRVVEAPLTGESVPVDKDPAAPADGDAPLSARGTMLFKATAVVAGQGTAVVTATGMETEVGRIGRLAGAVEPGRTPLERRLDALGRRLVGVALGVAVVVGLLALRQGLPWAQVVSTAIALAIAAVPEGLPVVATVAMAVGVRRMARRRVLVRSLPTVESLGSATVVCTDKTGTLTAGEMTVERLWLPWEELEVTGRGYDPAGQVARGGRPLDPASEPRLRPLLRAAALANRAALEQGPDGWTAVGDPTEAALLVAAAKAGVSRDALLRECPRTGELPFSADRLLMASFHRTPDGGTLACVKGAPRSIVTRCDSVLGPRGPAPLDDPLRARALAANRSLAARGLRVLALAEGTGPLAPDRLPEHLTLLGFAGMVDPPAPGVQETIGRFQGAGVRVVMLTGDQQATAEAVARGLGILGPADTAMDDRDLQRLPPADLDRSLPRVGAFSRVSPETKLRLVEAWQKRGEVVAMLGDGVNDAAALRRADVGVAMGRRGTDIARDAAGVVLADDRFETLGAAVEQGRVIVDNLAKFVFYLFSCNLAEILVLLGAGLIGLPLPLTPLQILWLNLVTDTFPALALALEPPEHDVMRRPPRPPASPILSAALSRAALGYAGLIAAVSLAAFGLGLARHPGDTLPAMTMGFMTLAFAQVRHLGNARSPNPVLSPRAALGNRMAVGAVLLAAGVQLAAAFWPPLAGPLRIARLDGPEWGLVVLLSLAPAVAGQLYKLVRAAYSSTSAG